MRPLTATPAQSIVQGKYCGDCAHATKGQRFVPPFGTGANGILELGDSPWFDEVRLGRPFAGAAGAMRQRVLRRLGTDERDFCVTNSMMCKPTHLGWTDYPERYPEAGAALRHCEPYLDDLIEALRPRVIVPLGNVALRRVCGVSGIEQRHSYVHSTPWGIPAVPTFHYSFVMQGNHKLTPAVTFAYRRAQEVAEGTYRPTRYELMLDPPVDDLRAYLGRFPHDLPEVMVDIETPESSHLAEDELEEKGVSFNIIRAGFALGDGVGVSFPFEYPYTEVMWEVLARASSVLEWTESMFDSRRLRAAGFELPERVVSPMWAWHMLQSDLPKSLGFVAPFYYAGPPWKHLSDAQPAFYNALDNAVAMTIWQGVRRDLTAQGRWPAFETHCIEVDPIFTAASRVGVQIDREAQQALRVRLEGERDEKLAELQEMVPPDVKPLKVWKRPPKDMEEVEQYEEACDVCTVLGVSIEGQTCKQCKGAQVVVRYRKRLAFNPRSSPQVIALIKACGLKPPRNGKEDRETTEAKHLKRLAKKRPVFRTILDYRERDKICTSYIWPLDSEGRIHPTVGHHPSTWRKSMRNPNAQTIPKRNDLAKEFRRMIVTEYEEDRGVREEGTCS